MAKFDVERLKGKYGFTPGNVTGEKLRELMDQIITHNNEQVSKKVAKISEQNWTKSTKKFNTKEYKTVIPNVGEVLPKRSVFIRKAAQTGDIISNDLRDRLTRDLRKTLQSFTPTTGEENFIIRRGQTAGRVNNKLVGEFQQQIEKTFQGYTKKDPNYKMPTNVNTIATTEVRGAINEIQESYKDEMKSKNPDLVFKKTWDHNSALSKMVKYIRRGHQMLNGKTINEDKLFEVKQYKKIGKRKYIIGVVFMSRPYDPNAPVGEIIGCHCGIRYSARKKALTQ